MPLHLQVVMQHLQVVLQHLQVVLQQLTLFQLRERSARNFGADQNGGVTCSREVAMVPLVDTTPIPDVERL